MKVPTRNERGGGVVAGVLKLSVPVQDKEEPRTTTEPAAAGESGEAAVATEHDGDAEAAEPASEETC
jgi:hypothetical protein